MYVQTSEACKFFNVKPGTLRKWDSKGKIKTRRTPSNKRLYFIPELSESMSEDRIINKTKKICYCRVSSKKQMDDLKRQEQSIQSKYPDYEIISDIGSGINWKRKGLLSILEQSNKGMVEEVVVSHRDRLARFSFELIQWLLEKNGTKLVVLNAPISEEEKLSDDLLSIIHIFNCRKMGKRRYQNKNNQNQNKSKESPI